MENKKMLFTGHDTFECRPFWLKKGYDHVASGKKFEDSAVVDLGVGKNMVYAINHWVKAFGIVENGKTTDLGSALLSADGYDPYLEDEGSLWLLHYEIVKRGFASIYSMMFNDIRRRKPEFSIEQIAKLLFIELKETSLKTLESDVKTFIRNYTNRSEQGEESYGGILSELFLISEIRKDSNKIIYSIQNSRAEQIPLHIFLYSILDFSKDQLSISFEQLLSDFNSPGLIFCLNREQLTIMLENLASELKTYGITYSVNAGVRELQFKKKLDKMNVLKNYYATVHA